MEFWQYLVNMIGKDGRYYRMFNIGIVISLSAGAATLGLVGAGVAVFFFTKGSA